MGYLACSGKNSSFVSVFRYSAIFLMVPYSFKSDSLKLLPNSFAISALKRIAEREVSPPVSSSAVTPSSLPERTSFTRSLTFCSVSFSGGTISSSEITGIFCKAFRSILPFGVIGISSSCLYAAGTIYSVRLPARKLRRSS